MFVIYGKDNCLWCDRAKELLESAYIFKNVESSRMHMEEFLEEFPGAKTVPKIISINDEGHTLMKFHSYEELVEYFNTYSYS